MASIRDVAKIAGVSAATVSRVMNNTANVDEEKKRRVFAAIEETEFKPNELARALFKKSSKIIGVIIPTIENPFFNEIAKAIEEEAFQNGYRLLLCNSNGYEEKEKINIEMLTQMNADGLIIMTNSDKTGEVISKCNLPVVVLDRLLSEDIGIAYIEADHYQGGKIAAEHLLECGCKNIVCLKGPQNLSSGKKRYQGYLDVCREHGLEVRFLECDYSYDSGLKAAEELLQKYPDADGIIATNDIVAISVYKILKNAGVRVPEDVQIIGFDNIQFSWLFTPEITTITQPIKQMGKKAVEVIINYINGEPFEKCCMFEVTLEKRQSTKINNR